MADKANKANIHSSEALKNIAEAGLFNVESKQKELLVKELEIGLQKKIRNAEIEASDDFNHGYFRWNDEIDASTVNLWTAMLRAYVRVNVNRKERRNIIIEFNSTGGNIIDGFQLFDEINLIRKQGFHVTIRVRGIAASMAAVIFQAADVRQVGPNSNLMIHSAGFGAKGKSFEVKDEVEFVNKLESQIVTIFAERSGKSKKYFEGLLDKRKDLYFNAEACIKEKLADEIA